MTETASSDSRGGGERPMPWPAMRPKIRSDALWVPTEDGVFLLCNANSLTIRGKHVSAWVERLAPRLNGDITVSELTNGLPEPHTRMLENLLGTLLRNGFVRDTSADEAHGLTEQELTAFAPEIAFIEYFCPSPAARFERFRDARITCVGSGLTLAGLVRALLLLGLRTVRVQPTTEHPTEAASWQELLPVTRERDPGQTVLEDTPCPDHELVSRLTPADVVIHIGDVPVPDRAADLATWATISGTTLLQAVVVEDEAWLGPFGTPLRPARWTDAWARITTGHAASPALTQQVSEFLAVPTARIVSGQLAFEAFRILAGVPAEDFRDRMVRIDLATMRTSEHHLPPVPAPAGNPGEAVTPGAPVQIRPGRQEQESFSRAARTLVDDRIGIITALGEEDIPQLPAHAAIARVSMAAGLETGSVYGAGLSIAAAREDAARRALELHTLVHAATAAPAAGRQPPLFHGHELDADRPLAVPVTEVVPLTGQVERDDYAIGSGPTWGMALWRAVADFVQLRLSSEQADEAASELSPVTLGPTAARCLRILEAANRKVRLRLLEQLPEGAVVLCNLDGEQFSTELGGTAAEAAAAAMLTAVRRLHAELTGAPVWRQRAAAPARPEACPPHKAAAATSLLHWLTAGRSPLAALRLEPRPEVAAVLPVVVCLHELRNPGTGTADPKAAG